MGDIGLMELRALATRFLPADRVVHLFDDAAMSGAAGSARIAAVEHELAAVIGASSARLLLEVVRQQRRDELDTVAAIVGEAAPASGAPADAGLAPVTVWLEEKYDGIRCQVHKQGERVELYSRDLKRITAQFPELAKSIQFLPGDFIGDGELLAWRDGRALPFAELQKRLGRKGDDFFLGAEIPVSVSLYDLLWLDGRSLLKEPLRTRRRLLESLLTRRPAPAAQPSVPALVLAPVREVHRADEIEAAFLAARQRGNEGLMAKDPASAYTPGRRGLAWLKLKKAYATLDVVVVGVEYGHGKRRDVLSDYTFAIRDEEHDNRLLTVGKAYSGLTDAEIAQLTEHFLAHTLEVRGRFRRVVPDTVLEIAFDIIQSSDRHESGFALRFPRSHERIAFRVESAEPIYFGLWHEERADGTRILAPEHCTGGFDRPDLARHYGQPCRFAAHETKRRRLEIDLHPAPAP